MTADQPTQHHAAGALLREARLERGLSRSELGRLAGCSRQYVEMLESGDRAGPSPRTVAALAAALVMDAVQRDCFYAAAGIARPAYRPAAPFNPAGKAALLLEAFPYPAFMVDSYWSVYAWNGWVPPVLEVYAPVLPAGAVTLLEVLFAPETRARFLNWDEAGAHLVASFKRDTRSLTQTVPYREALRALRGLPGFPAIFRSVKPSASAVAGSVFGFQNSVLGPLWLAEVLIGFAPGEPLRVVAYVPADPATVLALKRLEDAAPQRSN